MISQTIEQIKADLSKIKQFKKRSANKLTAESLKLYKGFEEMTLEKRQEIVNAMREYARIVLLFLKRTNKQQHG